MSVGDYVRYKRKGKAGIVVSCYGRWRIVALLDDGTLHRYLATSLITY